MIVLEKSIGQTTLTIWQDEFDISPRKEFDNFGRMVCWHRRYELGDDHTFYEPADFEALAKAEKWIVLPLYLLDHSMITIRTSSFNDPWDSGQIGYIYTTREQAREEFGVKHVTKKIEERVKDILRSEVETYDQYLRGDVYGFTLQDINGRVIESCGGFYGDIENSGLLDELPPAYIELVRKEL